MSSWFGGEDKKAADKKKKSRHDSDSDDSDSEADRRRRKKDRKKRRHDSDSSSDDSDSRDRRKDRKKDKKKRDRDDDEKHDNDDRRGGGSQESKEDAVIVHVAAEDDEEEQERLAAMQANEEMLAELQKKLARYQVRGAAGQGAEWKYVGWGLVKAVIWMLFFAACIYVSTKNYNEMKCIDDSVLWKGACVTNYLGIKKYVYGAVPVEGEQTGTACGDFQSPTCKADCGIDESNEYDKGCYYDGTSSVPGCLKFSDFVLKCKAPTCPTSQVTALKRGFYPAIAIVFAMLLWDVATAAGFMANAGHHTDDYPNLTSMGDRVTLCLAKTGLYVQQVLFFLFFLSWIYGVHVYTANAEDCADAKEADGPDKITLVPLYQGAIIAYTAIIVLCIVVGTTLRMNNPLRGELLNPSNDAEIFPPCGLDCKDARERPGPKCCPDMWRQCDEEGYVCPMVSIPLLNGLNTCFRCCIAPIGFMCEKLFKNRHEIGP